MGVKDIKKAAKGELKNNKITYPDDIKISKVSFGIGFDIHRLVKNKKMYRERKPLCGSKNEP